MESVEHVEDVESIETEPAGIVRRWHREKELADKRDKSWHKDAYEAIQTYGNDKSIGEDRDVHKETFNILWSNVETKRPALYSTTPRPDIRRRFKDKNPLAAAVSEILERAASFTFESSNFDKYMILAVNDMLLPGRAVTRVLYDPLFSDRPIMEDRQMMDEDENPLFDDFGEPMMEQVQMTDESGGGLFELDYEEVLYQQVPWKDFRMGPCKNWDECPWILFIHRPTKDQVKEKWGDEWAKKLKFTADKKQTSPNKDGNKKSGEQADSDIGLFKVTEVWEIWNKDTKEVIWVSADYKDEVIDQYPDPLDLEHFWPIPEPLYAIEFSTTTTPATEYGMYRTLAKELEEATNRIRFIMSSIRASGAYDSRMTEMQRLMEEEDNVFIPVESSALIEAGGLERAIYQLPIEQRLNVVVGLRQFRLDTIQQIYEITGISDILRGASNPHETAQAQRIKANFGAKRLERQQKDVQRYARDLLRLTIELISGFEPKTLSLITGLDFPTEEMKQQAQMAQQQQQILYQQQAQMAQMGGQEPPPPPEPDPQIQNILENPSWEEIMEVISSDMRREYLIDIETNSTIETDEMEDRQNMQEVFTALVQAIQAFTAAEQAGFMTKQVSAQILGSILRRFKFGREMEDALDEMVNQPPQQEPDPEAMKLEADMKLKEKDLELKEKDAELKEREFQAKEREMASEAQIKQLEARIDRQAAQQQLMADRLEFQQTTKEHQMKMEELARKEEADKAKHKRDMESYVMKKGELQRAS